MKSIPLTPKVGGGVCIDARALQPADIIVATTDAAASRFIRYATFSAVSHALLYAGNGRVIEAVGEGVRDTGLGAAIKEDILAVAYRHKQMTPTAAGTAIQFARKQVGKKYDYPGAAAAGLHNNTGLCVVLLGVLGCPAARNVDWEQPDRFFCSELVLAAYKAAGLSVVDAPPAHAAPDDIASAASTGILTYVGHLIA
jgi:uncharacterized protein YycO